MDPTEPPPTPTDVDAHGPASVITASIAAWCGLAIHTFFLVCILRLISDAPALDRAIIKLLLVLVGSILAHAALLLWLRANRGAILLRTRPERIKVALNAWSLLAITLFFMALTLPSMNVN
jgi:uncharacterized membrane protein YidH (DUF202 family)